MTLQKFSIPTIPDPRSGAHRAAAGGDVRSACFDSAAAVCRILADLPPGAGAFLEFRMCYRPSTDRHCLQERVHLDLTIGAEHEADFQALSTSVVFGPLSRFYPLEPDAGLAPEMETKLPFICDVIRRAGMTPPFVSRSRNAHVPAYYFSIKSFESNRENDFQTLDRILSGLAESLDISIAASPFDTTSMEATHASYLNQIESINRRDRDEDRPLTQDEDYFKPNRPFIAPARPARLQPYRRRDPLADENLRLHRRLHESLQKPHLLFQIRVAAASRATARLIASVLGDSMFQDGGFALVTRGAVTNSATQPGVAPCPPASAIPTIDSLGRHAMLGALIHAAPVEELLGAMRLPVSGAASPCCMRSDADPAPSKDDARSLLIGQDLEVWTPGRSGGLDRSLPLEILCKHLFGSGLPGSGKTTSIFNIMFQLREQGIPFVVFETAKREFRAIKRFRDHPDPAIRSLASELEIYTPGAEAISPLRFNPLEAIPGVSIDEQVEHNMSMFQASMPLSGPLPALLRQGLLALQASRSSESITPVLADLYEAVTRCVRAKGYSGDTHSDIRAALDVRLGLLTQGLTGRIFQSPQSSPAIERLVTGYSVIELDRLPAEAKCVVYFGIVQRLRRQLQNMPHSGGLRFVIFTEEAHNVIGVSTDARSSEEAADPRAFAAEAAVTALAEDRAAGISHVIIDQIPTAVAPQVIKNTGTKIAFRQVAVEDRELLGGAMLCDGPAQEELARLPVGEAYYFTEGYFRARRIRTDNLHAVMPDLARPCSDAELMELIRAAAWRQAAEIERRAGELERLTAILDRFDELRWRAGNQLHSMRSQTPGAPFSSPTPQALQTRINHLWKTVSDRLHALGCNELPRLLGDAAPEELSLCAWWEALRSRWNDVITPDTRAWLTRAQDMLEEPRWAVRGAHQ